MRNTIFKWGIFAVLAAMSAHASAWWNDAWPYRAPIMIDTSITGANIESTQTEIPVLVKLHFGNFQDFPLLKEDLSDIRFIANDDKTPLKYSVEFMDVANQMAFIWVKLPQLTGGIATERLWMYYGNADAVPVADAPGIYNIDQSLILNFGPVETAFVDKTAYANPVENSGVTLEQAGAIAAAAKFEGTQFLIAKDTPSIRMIPEKGATVSAWVKPVGQQIDGVLFNRSVGTNSFTVGINGNLLYAELHNGNSVFATPRSTTIQADAWQHVAVTITADTLKLFLNGEVVNSIPVQWNELGGDLIVGASSSGDRGFIGELDDVRFDKVARSADWINTSVFNQGAEDKLLSLLPAEQLGAGNSGGVFKVILDSIDESGWAIIFLLGIMSAISWLVMIGKLVYIRSAQRDNVAFLTLYRQLGGGDPAQLDAEESEDEKKLAESPIAQALLGKHDHFQSSPIYHLYHNVLNDVRGRMGKTVGAKAAGLTPAAINSIRAAMDAEMTREAQKMNGQMVLLTIAISGGPFLGLLGTVVGVMVTFATIAASGDVNIAAIAPGVAAALATTVAGLFVAIPALFGYNYIFSRIKEAMVDMRVFADEFVARVAEYYGNE